MTMSARIAHRAFTATARRSLLRSGLSSSASRVTCRNASTSSHGPEVSSDKPWIIGSLLVFGSAFLYLISPTARKGHHVEHKDKHDFPALMHDEHSKVKKDKTAELEPELVKDDEGKIADVASSVVLAEASDVPNDAQTAEKHVEIKEAAEGDSSEPVEEDSAPSPTATDEGEKTEKTEKTETAQEGDRKLPKEPTNMGEARQAAVENVTPKEGAERKN